MKFQLKNEQNDLIVLIPCPEFYGADFFSKDHEYKIKLTVDTSSHSAYLIINKYEKLQLSTYYAIDVVKN